MIFTRPIRSLIGIGVISEFVWFFWFHRQIVGFNGETRNAATRVTAGTSPVLLAIAAINVLVLLMLSRSELPPRLEVVQSPSMWRRAAAFAVDLWFSLFTLSAVFGLIPVIVEAARTGTFQWTFERDYWTASDWINAVSIIFFTAAMFLYFAWPLTRRSQTLGCWLFRLALVDGNGNVLRISFSKSVRRSFMEFCGVCTPWRTLSQRDADGHTWYDHETGLTVVHF